MNAKRHTHGPWSTDAAGSIPAQMDASVPMMDYQVALVVSPVRGEKGQAVREANAHLIAAAPELLEVAQLILAEDLLDFLPEEYASKVRAAVAKATGSSQ